ncbi:unnamed protein product [Closterium sp. NIES-64]|nr:unnamed protein product [Closterium sp. NIES-64]
MIVITILVLPIQPAPFLHSHFFLPPGVQYYLNVIVIMILVLPVLILALDLRIMPPGPIFETTRLYIILLVPYVFTSRLLCLGLFSRLPNGMMVQLRGEQVCGRTTRVGNSGRRLSTPPANGVTNFQPTQATVCNFSRSGQWLSRNKAPYGADCPFLKNVGPVNCIIKPRNRPKNWLNYRYRPKNCGQPWFSFAPLAFLQRMRNRVFASVGDSLSVSNLMPSLLCQLHQVSPVTEIPNNGTYAKQGPLTKVYQVKAYNVTLVNTWSTFLNEYWQDEQTVQQYNGGVALTDEDSVVNLDGLDAQWAAYIERYDVLILQTQAHWQATKYKWRRFWVNSTGDQIFNESRFLAAFEYGMEAIKNLLDQPEAPVTYFISAPARLDGCKALKAPYSDAQVATIRKNNRQFIAWALVLALVLGFSLWQPTGCLMPLLFLLELRTSQKTPSLHVAKPSPCLSSAHPPSPALSLPLLIFPTTILPSPSPQRVFASAGDSLSYFNFIPSLLCQVLTLEIHQASPVRSIPVPPRLAPRTSLVYHVPQYNVTIVNTWSTFLNQCWQDKQTLALYNHGRPVTPEDSVVNMEGVDWRWGRYLAKAGMQSVKKLVDRANDKVTRGSSSGSNNSRGSSSVGGSAAGGNKWPVVFFLSAPTKQSGCAASFEPRTEGEVRYGA